MGKRVAIASDFRPKKCSKREISVEDGISQLPDDILVHILSFFTLKEAARTATLSTRWKHLWKYTPRLDFDAAEALDKVNQALDEVEGSDKLQEQESLAYVKWVNQVLELHKSSKLTEFRVCFDITKSHHRSIRKWIKHAYAREVHKLELNLLEGGQDIRLFQHSFTFPNPLRLTSSRRPSSDCCGFKSLRELCLKCVNVSGEVLEYFLLKCPLLEWLVVHGSGDLVTLEVSGPSLKLKHLEICYCYDTESIKVSDTNLVSLKVMVAGNKLQLHNVPMLVEVSFGGRGDGYLSDVFSWLSCCLSQLEVLTLDISNDEIKMMERRTFPELTQLKQLVLVAEARKDKSLIGITSLMRVCPFLQKFVLKLLWMGPIRRRRMFKKAIESPLKQLKEVEFSGYYGRTSELELVTYFLGNASALEKIIIDPRNQLYTSLHPRDFEIKKEQAARHCAKKQLRVIPEHVELVIL